RVRHGPLEEGEAVSPILPAADEGDGADTARDSARSRRLDPLVADKPFAKKWRTQLARADIKLAVAEYAALHVISMFGFFALGYFVLFPQSLVMGLVSGFVGFFATRLYVSRTIELRIGLFHNLLPHT